MNELSAVMSHGFFDQLDFLQAENQAIDRVHRIGQKHDVTVHKLFMAGDK